MVQSLSEEGGWWLTLDGRMLFKARVMASEHYNTHLEAGLVERLGISFTVRPIPEGKRPVREIEGIDPVLLTTWSTRRQAIETRQRELASTFLAEHGRTPTTTTTESLALAQQANLETRPGKHEPRSRPSNARPGGRRRPPCSPARTKPGGHGRVGGGSEVGTHPGAQ